MRRPQQRRQSGFGRRAELQGIVVDRKAGAGGRKAQLVLAFGAVVQGAGHAVHGGRQQFRGQLQNAFPLLWRGRRLGETQGLEKNVCFRHRHGAAFRSCLGRRGGLGFRVGLWRACSRFAAEWAGFAAFIVVIRFGIPVFRDQLLLLGHGHNGLQSAQKWIRVVRRQNRPGLAAAEQVVVFAHAFAGHEFFFLFHGREGIQGQALGAAEDIFHIFGRTGIRAGVVQQAGHDRVRADDEALAVFDAVAAVLAHGFVGQGEKDAVGADVLEIEVAVLKGDQRVLAGNFT